MPCEAKSMEAELPLWVTSGSQGQRQRCLHLGNSRHFQNLFRNLSTEEQQTKIPGYRIKDASIRTCVRELFRAMAAESQKT